MRSTLEAGGAAPYPALRSATPTIDLVPTHRGPAPVGRREQTRRVSNANRLPGAQRWSPPAVRGGRNVAHGCWRATRLALTVGCSGLAGGDPAIVAATEPPGETGRHHDPPQDIVHPSVP